MAFSSPLLRSSVVFVLLPFVVTLCSGASIAPCQGLKCPRKFRETDTTERLSQLRNLMVENNIEAYIVTVGDEHQSGNLADHDRRRAFISGFTGSAGDAVITRTKAALWTDSRYFLQAEQQLDDNWDLMKIGVQGTPSMEQWIIDNVPSGTEISSDPKIASADQWIGWETSLSKANIQLKKLDNLIDMIWTDQPPYSDNTIFIQYLDFAGESWQSKMERLRTWMTQEGVDCLVISELDEVAWLLNLRGSDVRDSPLFRAYLIVTLQDATLYVSLSKITPEVSQHLNSQSSDPATRVRTKEHDDVWQDLANLATSIQKVVLPSQFSYTLGVSYLIYSQFPASKIMRTTSPVLKMKEQKNEVEALGMINAHIRDAVALCQFHQELEQAVASGETWDELKAAEVLDTYRSKQKNFVSLSFGTIAAVGPHAALPHYGPTVESNVNIDPQGILLVDSGGQYLDGTTDVTRTMHFGTPTEEQRTIYTRLLMGCIDLVTTTFPQGTTVWNLDSIVRRQLWGLGLDYGHNTTHGIGSFLNDHEAYSADFHVNFFGSQEPGYYREGEFGMRLENIIKVVATNQTIGTGQPLLRFEAVTLFPYEANLINTNLLTSEQKQWLTSYNNKILELVGNELTNQGLSSTLDWLTQKINQLQVKL